MTGDTGDDGREGAQRPEQDTTDDIAVVGEAVADALATDGGFESGFFEAVVERIGVGVGVYESDGRFAYVNRAYADLLGMDRAALQGTPVWAVNPAVDEDRFEEYWESFTVGETRQRETRHTHSDGSELPVETHTTAIEVDGTRYNVGTIADIGERVEGRAQLERQNERLEQFASVVSHDLRNPLNVAMGRLQLAKEETDSEHLAHVERSLDRMEALIEDVLTMARDGNRITEPEPVTVKSVVRRAWQTVGSPAAELSVEDDLGTVQSDENRLMEVFENLFDNAVTHAGEDVTVRVGRTDDGLYVADDGPGVPDDELDDITEYGYTTTEDGTGFGLTIVEQIVTAHDWTLSLSQSDNGGLRFDIGAVEFE